MVYISSNNDQSPLYWLCRKIDVSAEDFESGFMLIATELTPISKSKVQIEVVVLIDQIKGL